ncbi:cytochrome P450 [Aspergillus spectabilis]
MLELATRPDIQTRLYTELSQGLRANYGAEDLDRMPLLSAVLYETLRLYPPLGTLTNRRTTEPFLLGSDIFVPPGTLIGWHAYGVHTDPQVWGDNARQFDPDRWGKDPEAIHWMFRTQQAKGRYIPFGIYSRRCLGSAFALTQLRVALCELVRSFEWELPADHVFSFSLAVLVAPDDCTLILRKRAG